MTTETTATTVAVPQETAVPKLAAYVNVVALIAGIALIVMNAIDVESPIRVALAVLLIAVGAGSGLVQFLKLREPALQLGLIFATSLAIDLLLAQTFLSVESIGGLGGAIVLTAIAAIRPYGRPKRREINLEEDA